jgi:hypothetical protein
VSQSLIVLLFSKYVSEASGKSRKAGSNDEEVFGQFATGTVKFTESQKICPIIPCAKSDSYTLTKYEKAKNTKYERATNYEKNVGKNEKFFLESSKENEIVRSSQSTESSLGIDPSAKLNNTNLNCPISAPTAPSGIASRREGILLVKMLSNKRYNAGKNHFSSIGTADEIEDLTIGDRSTEDNYYEIDISNDALDSKVSSAIENYDPFTVGFMAKDESSSGLLAGMSSCQLTVNYDVPEEAPSAPSPVSPNDNALVESSVTFSWTSSNGNPTPTYRLRVDDDASITDNPIVDKEGLSSTSKTISGLDRNKTYYWGVVASNSAGQKGFFSEKFRVRPATPTNVEKSINSSSHPVLDWDDVSGADSYSVTRTVIGFSTNSTTEFISLSSSFTDSSTCVRGLVSTTPPVVYYSITSENSKGWESKSTRDYEFDKISCNKNKF